MYVKRIVEDNWSGVRSDDIGYPCEEIIQIEAAIKKLNGQNKTCIYFEAGEEKSLTISGGNDGRFVAFVTVGIDAEFYNLIDPQQSQDKMIELKTSGQWGQYSARQCVDLESVLQAARQFAIDGGMSPLVAWEKQA